MPSIEVNDDETHAAARQMVVDLMPDHTVRVIFRCDSAYEAAILYDDILEKARTGSVVLSMGTKIVREES